jgi:hypothetical protein
MLSKGLHVAVCMCDCVTNCTEGSTEGSLCQKNPCQNIAAAIVNSCKDINRLDFECSCQPDHNWDDDTNACIRSSSDQLGKMK